MNAPSDQRVPLSPPVRIQLSGRFIGNGVVLAGLLLLATGCAPTPAADKAAPAVEKALPRVVAAKPAKKPLKLISNQPATIEPLQMTPIYAKVAGFVETIKVDIGAEVKGGNPLAILKIPELIDDVRQQEALEQQAVAGVAQSTAEITLAQSGVTAAEAKLTQAEAAVERVEAEYERARLENERIASLVASGSVTRKLADETENRLKAASSARAETKAAIAAAKAGVEEATAKVAKAKADAKASDAKLAVAKSNVTKAKTLAAYGEITAPYDGVIIKRQVNEGHFVQPADAAGARPLFVIMQAKKVRVFADIPEVEAPLVDVGDAATIRVQALSDRTFSGKVTRTAWALDASNRALRTEIELDNAAGHLRPGMFATVAITVAERKDAFVLASGAIVREGEGTFCHCVAQGKIERRPIKLGLHVGDEWEVTEGLRGDEEVVMVRAASFAPGSAVEILPPEKPGA